MIHCVCLALRRLVFSTLMPSVYDVCIFTCKLALTSLCTVVFAFSFVCVDAYGLLHLLLLMWLYVFHVPT